MGFVKKIETLLIPSFLIFLDKQIHHLKWFGKGNKILKSNFEFPHNENFGSSAKIFIIEEIRNLISESCFSCQTLSDDVFVCPKNSKMKE